MQDKLIRVLIITFAIFAALWGITTSVTLPERYQIPILVSLSGIALLILIFRKLPFDYKFLSLLLLGYAFAGKGFAYISPLDPIYIGEIVLVICILGYLHRLLTGFPLFPDRLHGLIFFWMAAVGISLFFGFQEFGLVAIRDSTIGYYGIFFFASFAMFRDGKLNKKFGKVLIACIAAAYLSGILQVSGIHGRFIAQSILGRFIAPHPDAFLPLVAAGAMWGLLEGLNRRSPLFFLFGGTGFILLLGSKTAGIFCLLVVMGFLLVFARRVDLFMISAFALFMASIVVAILIASGSTTIKDKLLESDQLKTFSDLENVTGEGNTSTTDWRISWWTVIVEDTMEENPFFGTAMGSDITGHFLESIMTIDPSSPAGQSYARYPHSIIFTVFGRMGFVGLTIFSVLVFGFCSFTIAYARRYLNSRAVETTGMLALLIFLAGLANAFVQATYEIPHGAIINWVCLGYLVAHYHQGRFSQQPNQNTIEAKKPQNA